MAALKLILKSALQLGLRRNSRGEYPKNRGAGSTALAALALQQGVQAFRVHDVAMTVNGHSKVRHLKRLKLSCLKDDTAKSAGEVLLQIVSSSAALRALQLIDLGCFDF